MYEKLFSRLFYVEKHVLFSLENIHWIVWLGLFRDTLIQIAIRSQERATPL